MQMQSNTMNNGTRRAMAGSIHKIREFELEKVCLVDEFDILQIVGEGWFGKILLVEHRATDTEMVLKALPKPYVSIRDFYREFHYGLHLSAHRNIVTTYDVAFETAGFYVFSQEYAPLGDLTSNMMDTGIGELHTKRVAKQLAAALEHLHQRDLVHRDVKLDNILVFKSDFSRVKLCDFGETRKLQSTVRRRNEWLPYSPPEVLHTPVDNSYKALLVHDIWQYGIVIFICLTGCLPWQKAAMDDPRYVSYLNWYNSSNPLRRQPKLWKMVSSKAQKMFKKFIEPRLDRRATNFIELSRYMEDRWMAKGYTDRIAGSDIDELCPSMYSFHSDVNEKNIVLKYFKEQGLETIVDRQAKKQRIRDWIQNSIITEETEEEIENHYEPAIFDEESEGELEERTRLHPIQDRSSKDKLRYANEKHINPRTGEIMVGKPTNQLSYDVQNIEPVASINATRKPTKEESVPDSNKDSDYGSIDTKGTHTSNSFRNDLSNGSNNSPARSLSGSVKNTKSPIPSRVQKINDYQGDNFSSFERSSSSGLQGSTSTLQSLTYTARDKTIQNGYAQNVTYNPMKETIYNEANAPEAVTDDRSDSPYTAHLNIIQGQMKISPLGKLPKDNIVNVSVTSMKRNTNA